MTSRLCFERCVGLDMNPIEECVSTRLLCTAIAQIPSDDIAGKFREIHGDFRPHPGESFTTESLSSIHHNLIDKNLRCYRAKVLDLHLTLVKKFAARERVC